MRPLQLTLTSLALTAIPSNAQGYPPPGGGERMCRDSEQSYSGPPMPKVTALDFKGPACPKQGRVGYNYRGLWSCHRKWDVQFIIPEMMLRAEAGQLVKGECAITFRVDELGAGWQVALDAGQVDGYVEMSPRSRIGFTGAHDWEGGVKADGMRWVGQNDNGQSMAKLNHYGMNFLFRNTYVEWSPCSGADKVVGNVTAKAIFDLDARRSTGHALISTGSWVDEQSGDDIVDAATFNFKWLIKKCGT